MNPKILRLTGFFGIVTPLVGFLMVALSISQAPWFRWTEHALSNLGAAGFESVIFNSGLPMTGAVMMMFSAGLFELVGKNDVGRIGAILHLASALLLIGIGIANINVRPYHYYVSVGFFVALPLAVITIGIYNFTHGMRQYALIAWLTGLLAAVIWALPWSSAAIPEALSAASASIWQVILGLWMFRRK